MSDRKPLVFMAEDDEEVAQLNARMLRRKGYDVLLAFTFGEARTLIQVNKPDLFVLDIELPDGDGFALCRDIRRDSDAPILFLTGRKELSDKLTGFNTGGDYYLTKPYSMEEFIAVTGSLLRREEQTQSKLEKAVRESSVITRGTLTLQIPQGKALINGRDAELTSKEFAVLLMLVQNEDKELTGEAIYESVWGTTMNGDSNALRNHISRLKKKIGEEDTDDFSIISIYGEGYTFTTK